MLTRLGSAATPLGWVAAGRESSWWPTSPGTAPPWASSRDWS